MERIGQTTMKNACALALREAEAQSAATHESDPGSGRLKRSVGQVCSRAVCAQRWLHAVVFIMAVACAPMASAQPAPLPADSPPPPLPIEQMRAFGYTKEFAQRFALPAPEPGWEPSEGLLAVEFRVRPISGSEGLYNCDFKLYIDSRLDIAFPEPGPSGSSRLYTDLTHPFIARGKDVPKISEADRRARFERQSAFFQLSAFATDDYEPGKRGALISSGPQEFVRNLFPGVHYMDSDNCSFAKWLSHRATGVKVWVKRAGGEDYRRDLPQDPNDFYQFTLPPALLSNAQPWADWVERHTHWTYWGNGTRNGQAQQR